MRTTRSPIILYPFFLAIFAPVALYVRNLPLIGFSELLLVILIIYASLGVLWWITNKILNNRSKAALLVTIFCILIFSFGHVFTAIGELVLHYAGLDIRSSLFTNFNTKLYALLIMWTAIFLISIFLINRSRSDLHLVTNFLNFSSVILMLLLVYQSVISYLHIQNVNAEIYNTYQYITLPDNELSMQSTSNRSNFPNIYYIVLDAYGRDDILEKFYDFNNEDLLNYLSNRGFFTARESRANYAFTLLSLSSSLNMMYLEDITTQLGDASKNKIAVSYLIQSNRLSEFLSNLGYTTITFETGYYGTELNTADRYYSPGYSMTAFHNELINLTPSRIWTRDYQIENHRKRILYTFEQLPNVIESDQPTFVFAHIVAPRQPFVFGQNGEVNKEIEHVTIGVDNLPFVNDEKEYTRRYRDQVIYLNELLKNTIDEILETQGQNSIILVQGDHGPRSMTDWSSVERTNVNERMGILNAYYFPDQNYSNLTSDITPINSFRVILDQFFETNLGKIEDKSYFSLLESQFEFLDVTDQTTRP